MSDPLIGRVLTLPDGPWAGVRVRVVGSVVPKAPKLPILQYVVERLDTGERGQRMYLDVMVIAAMEGQKK